MQQHTRTIGDEGPSRFDRMSQNSEQLRGVYVDAASRNLIVRPRIFLVVNSHFCQYEP